MKDNSQSEITEDPLQKSLMKDWLLVHRDNSVTEITRKIEKLLDLAKKQGSMTDLF